MMQLRPTRAPRRACTSAQTDVPAPISTPASISAVAWMRTSPESLTRWSGDVGRGSRVTDHAYRRRRDRDPLPARDRPVGGGDDVDGCDGVVGGDEQRFGATHRAREVQDLGAQG